MSQSDWTYLTESLDSNLVRRGVTAGLTPPPGADNFVYAVNSTDVVAGAVGLFANQDGFAPMPLGGSISGVLQRAPSGGPLGFSPFFFLSCQGPSVSNAAYMIGLSDEDPHRIVLRKSSIIGGIGDSEGAGVLLHSSESFLLGTYLHLKLEAVYNQNGDVVLNVAMNDLEEHPLDQDPVWQEIPGMPRFIDDVTGINSGSAPLAPGRAGFGFAVKDTARRAYFDHIQVAKQLELDGGNSNQSLTG